MPFTLVVIFMWVIGTQMIYVGADGYVWTEREIPDYLFEPSLYDNNDEIYSSWSYSSNEATVSIFF